MKIYKISQNYQYQGFYSGDVPEQALGYLGTSAVESSQINSVFGKASEAINLVNRFDSSLLYNISFIFNFSKGGAYGVYLSELDRAIKTKALKKQLEQKGYEIKETGEGLTAFSKKEEKTPEQIQQDIDQLYSQLQQKGGAAIGVNVASVLNAAKLDAAEAKSPDPDMWQWIAILHLGGTIVHEALHAKGNMDEGPSEQAEANFTQWALPIINEEYKRSMEGMGKGDEFNPLTITTNKRHAKGSNWYKTAQMAYYIPPSFLERATGSDLSGRFPNRTKDQAGEWSMMSQIDQSIPIESRLGRQYMSKIPNDLDQSHDSIEEQLRKYTRNDWKLDPKASMEEMLSEGYDLDRGYTTLEGLLNEKRPSPLMVPIKKASNNKLTKIATLFGWMNNLTISDGNTIPGLGDRVMAWDDRDEDFAEEETWIKQQPRYNPSAETYDLKGMYYRWIDPKLHPQKWDEMVGDNANVHPAKRFASSETQPHVSKILSVLSEAKEKISKEEIQATRFVASDDILPLIEKVFKGDIKVMLFRLDKKEEVTYAVWVFSNKISEEEIEKIEKYINNKGVVDINIDDRIENILGLSRRKEMAVGRIIEAFKDITKEHNIKNTCIIGSYPRDLVTKTFSSLIDNLDFAGGWSDQNIKIGSIVAEKLGVSNVNISHEVLSFIYEDIKVNFNGNYAPIEIKSALRDQGIAVDSLTTNLYNKDFTINALVYDLQDEMIKDVTDKAIPDLKNKIIRTLLDADYVCKLNPMIILRALKFKIRYGFNIDKDLQNAMSKNKELLFDGRYNESELIMARENVKREGRKEAEYLFKVYGLSQLELIK